MLESFFNKVVGPKAYHFVKKRLQQRCFTLNITKNFKTNILKNICRHVFVLTDDIKQGQNAVGTHGKSKRVQSYSLYCEYYLHLILSLACIILLYLYYVLYNKSNLYPFSFLIRSKINNLIVDFHCISYGFFTLQLGYYNMMT